MGPKPEDPNQHAKRKWRGRGFNLIWRPNFGSQFGPKPFFLQLNLTEEELDFTEITGTGIANRSLFEPTITLGGIAYIQAIKDSVDQTGQHFEPGVWAHVPKTANPQEPSTVVRMGSIPHGTTINLQGTAADPVMTKPTFRPASITPFVGNHDDGETGLIPHNNLSRTDKNRLPGLTRDHLKESEPVFVGRPRTSNRSQHNGPETYVEHEAGMLSSDVGGGTANIAFLTGKGDVHTGGGPNAAAPVVSATFWIEEVRDSDGAEFAQLQYSQRVLLNFEWPELAPHHSGDPQTRSRWLTRLKGSRR